jgi:hypothetical protein
MNGRCFEIGIIQAFLDGELDSTLSAKVTDHVSDCDACASVLATAEEETAVVFSALERELNTLVPTQRLWSKINDSITVEREQTPFVSKVWAFVKTGLASPSLAAAASILIAFVVFAGFWGSLSDDPTGSEMANVTAGNSVQPTVVAVSNTPDKITPVDPVEIASDPRTSEPSNFKNEAIRASHKADSRQPSVRRDDVRPTAMTAVYMPGEESYVKTIATMSQTINPQKDNILRPSERIAYERDMAVVNDSIKRLRQEVRKNPRNESARQVLYSSYQNKIDLLNSVSQKEELIASLEQ